MGTLAHLWPYIWPGDRADLKMRVRLVDGAAARRQAGRRWCVPFTFKWATDALTGANYRAGAVRRTGMLLGDRARHCC